MNTLPWAIIISALALIFTAASFWKSHKKDKIQLKVIPQLYRHEQSGVLRSTRIPDNLSEIWHGICVEVINVGFIAATVEQIGLKLVDDGDEKVIFFSQGQLLNKEKLPQRVDPKSSIVFYIPSVTPSSFLHEGLPFAECFYAKTSCGLNFYGNSKVTNWLIAKAK